MKENRNENCGGLDVKRHFLHRNFPKALQFIKKFQQFCYVDDYDDKELKVMARKNPLNIDQTRYVGIVDNYENSDEFLKSSERKRSIEREFCMQKIVLLQSSLKKMSRRPKGIT